VELVEKPSVFVSGKYMPFVAAVLAFGTNRLPVMTVPVIVLLPVIAPVTPKVPPMVELPDRESVAADSAVIDSVPIVAVPDTLRLVVYQFVARTFPAITSAISAMPSRIALFRFAGEQFSAMFVPAISELLPGVVL